MGPVGWEMAAMAGGRTVVSVVVVGVVVGGLGWESVFLPASSENSEARPKTRRNGPITSTGSLPLLVLCKRTGELKFAYPGGVGRCRNCLFGNVTYTRYE